MPEFRLGKACTVDELIEILTKALVSSDLKGSDEWWGWDNGDLIVGNYSVGSCHYDRKPS